MNETSFTSILSKDLRVLFLLFNKPNHESYLEELATMSRIPKTTIKRSLDNLIESGFIIKRDDGYRNYYIVKENHLINQLKKIKNLDSQVIWLSLKRLKKGSLILYGSRSSGTNDEQSDWDLLLIGDGIDARVVNMEVNSIERETGESINIMILTRSEIESMSKSKNTFYLELLRNHHILRGDPDEL